MKFAFRWYGDGDAASLAAFFRRNYSNSRGEGEGGFNSRQGLEESAIGLEGDLCLESSSGLTFSNGLEKGKIFEFFYFYMYTR